jgi:hypothetical protein
LIISIILSLIIRQSSFNMQFYTRYSVVALVVMNTCYLVVALVVMNINVLIYQPEHRKDYSHHLVYYGRCFSVHHRCLSSCWWNRLFLGIFGCSLSESQRETESEARTIVQVERHTLIGSNPDSVNTRERQNNKTSQESSTSQVHVYLCTVHLYLYNTDMWSQNKTWRKVIMNYLYYIIILLLFMFIL